MKRTVVSYRIKSDRIEENTRLLQNVFQELEAKALPGVHYVTLQTGDGWYTHFATVDTDGVNPITTLGFVQAYVAGVKLRGPPQQSNDGATVVGIIWCSAGDRHRSRPEHATAHEIVPDNAESRATFDRLLAALQHGFHHIARAHSGSSGHRR